MQHTFEALVARGPRDLRYEQVPFRPCGPTELLVKVESASMCNGSDRNMYLGHERYEYPFTFGHEPFGTVADRGSAVSAYAVGDDVSWWFSVGAFAQYCYVDTAKVGLARVAGRFDRSAASMLELATATARAVWASGVRPDHRVLVIGLGPSGLLLTQQLRLAGVQDIEGWEVLPRRTATGRSFGLARTLDPLNNAVLLDRVHGEPFDLVFDCFGDDARDEGDTVVAALSALRPGGTLIRYGHPSVPRRLDADRIERDNLQVIVPAVPLWVVRDLIEQQVDDFVGGRLDLAALVSHRIGFSAVESTLLDQMQSPDDYLKAVVQM